MPSPAGRLILVITPTPDEYRPLRSALRVAELSRKGIRSSVRVVAIGKQGQSAAYACATRVLEEFHPSLVILAGIAGARFDADVGAFDCIAAVSCVDYSVSERLPGGTNRPSSEPFGPTVPRAEQFTSGLAQWETDLVLDIDRYLRRLGETAPRHRMRAEDVTARGGSVRRAIAHALRRHAARPRRRFVIASVCSGNDLHKDADYLHELIGADKRLAIVEMEFAGIARACNQAGVPCLMIRAISDIVGYSKQQAWTSHATVVAASAVRALLLHHGFSTWIQEVERSPPTVLSLRRHAVVPQPRENPTTLAAPRSAAVSARRRPDARLRAPIHPRELRAALQTRRLQIALDVTSIQEGQRLAGIAADAGAHLLEVGDPLLRRFGFPAVTSIRRRCPHTPIVAELASSDWADEQIHLAASAGADIVAFLGLVNRARIARAVDAARTAKVGLFLEVPRYEAPLGWCRMAEELGVDGLMIIRNIDSTTTPTDSWNRVASIRRGSAIPIAVSGGFSPHDIAEGISISWNVVIVGRAVMNAPDPRSVVQRLVSLVRKRGPSKTRRPVRSGKDA